MSDKRGLLLREKKSAYEVLSEHEWENILDYSKGYMAFLDAGKTERECVCEIEKLAQSHGFSCWDRTRDKAVPGGAFYTQKHGKAIMLAVPGCRPISQGVRMVASHIDSPRIDLKPYPLYEKDGFAIFKTHYYGGIKKYQWMATPLSLHGAVYLKNGDLKEVSIGGNPGDPVLFISDVLPHLAKNQSDKTVGKAFSGENLNATAGARPDQDQGDDRIKLRVLDILHERYGMTENDFQSAELCLCPANKARDVGLDRSMIGAYGQDDRACAYAALKAILEVKNPEYTTACIMADKEEIGSEGITGMQSGFFDAVLRDMCSEQGVSLYECYENSFCLSGDVCNAFDPNFADVSDPQNNARAGFGPGVFKATGHRGKSGASDASGQTMSRLRQLLDDAGVPWQMGEMGKVDQGGGGTVAKYIANRGIEVVDIGVPVISMHSTFEVTAKIDCYFTYKAFLAQFMSGNS